MSLQTRIRYQRLLREAEGYLELGLPHLAIETLRRLGPPAAITASIHSAKVTLAMQTAAFLFTALFGAASHNWLGDPSTVMGCLALMTVWKEAGFFMIFYLAALQGINPSLREAAAIEGAGRWFYFRRVLWPLLMPTTLFIGVNAVINAFRMVDHVFVMTRGGPDNATALLLFHLYEVGFNHFWRGKSDGGWGDQIIHAGAGNDVLVYASQADYTGDTINDASGTADAIRFASTTAATFTLADSDLASLSTGEVQRFEVVANPGDRQLFIHGALVSALRRFEDRKAEQGQATFGNPVDPLTTVTEGPWYVDLEPRTRGRCLLAPRRPG